jgi:peptidoglycan/xylan/chitin deacetylase (PgdA/CDA1 family)
MDPMWILPAIFAAVLALAHVAPFPFVLDWANRDVAMWKVPAQATGDGVGPRVYLTFDDGPNPAATPALLDVLARHKVRATFFIIDHHLTPETASLVRRAADEGHGIALHADSRALMAMRDDDVVRTLEAAEARMEQLTGVRPCPAFRPHAGARSSDMMTGLRRSGRRLIGWSFLLWDWDWFRAPRPERLADRISRRAGPGSIVVLHDGDDRAARAERRYTVDTVDRLVPRLRAKGFTFGTICDAIAERTADG